MQFEDNGYAFDASANASIQKTPDFPLNQDRLMC